jgi:hypothetical protein
LYIRLAASNEAKATQIHENGQFPPENGLFQKSDIPPLIGEQSPSCYHPLYVSRKFCKKVTRTLFPNEINGFATNWPAKNNLFSAVNKILTPKTGGKPSRRIKNNVSSAFPRLAVKTYA